MYFAPNCVGPVLGWVPNSVLLRVPTELRRYYRVSIHIKSFGTKFRYLRTHLGANERERERDLVT